MDTEKVILRISPEGELLGQYDNVKHAANIIDGNSQCIYNSIETKRSYRKSFWQYGFIEKETEITVQKQEHRNEQEVLCLKCGNEFSTHNEKINRICPKCNIVNKNIFDNTTVHKTHCSV